MYRDSLNSTRYEPFKVVRTKTVFDLPLKLVEPSKIHSTGLRIACAHDGRCGNRGSITRCLIIA